MEAGDWAYALRFIRAVTAEANGVRSAGFFDRGSKGISDTFLIAAKIFGGMIARDHGIDGARAIEGSRQRGRVFDVSHESVGAVGHEALETVFAAPDHAHFLALREQGVRDDAARMSCRSGDHVHGEPPHCCITFESDARAAARDSHHR